MSLGVNRHPNVIGHVRMIAIRAATVAEPFAGTLLAPTWNRLRGCFVLPKQLLDCTDQWPVVVGFFDNVPRLV